MRGRPSFPMTTLPGKGLVRPLEMGSAPTPTHLARQHPTGCRGGGTFVLASTKCLRCQRPLGEICGALAVSWPQKGYRIEYEARFLPSRGAHEPRNSAASRANPGVTH